MNRKLLLIGAVIAAVGAFTLTRPNGPAVSSNLRDAVAEGSQGFNTDISGIGKSDANIPQPEAPKAEYGLQEHADAAGSGIMFKSLEPIYAARRRPTKPVMTAEDGAISLRRGPKANVRADARLRDLPGATAFDKLKHLYEQGVPATKQDLLGWHAGRTVYGEAKDKFVAALVVGKDIPLNPDGGPLFEGQTEFKLLFPINSTAPDYFDAMDAARTAEVEGLIKNLSGKYLYTVSFPKAEIEFESSAEMITRAIERKSGDYLVDYWAAIDKKTGEIKGEAYAYYFKDVTPKK